MAHLWNSLVLKQYFFFYSIDECMYQEQSLIYTHAALFEY